VHNGILRDVFVQDADLVDAVHEAPQLCYRRPCKPARFVKGFEPLLYFKRLNVLRDLLTESFDQVVTDIVLNDGDGVCRFRAHCIRQSRGEVRVAFERQAAEDWRAFLSLRASELRPGGRLVIVLPGLNDEGASGLEDFFNGANAVLAELVVDGVITATERSHMVLGSFPRRRVELLEPFQADGVFQLPDAAWLDYEHDGNKEVLANRHAGFFRAIFVPSLASALTNDEARASFADAVELRLKRRVSERPMPLHTFVQTMVVAKQRAAARPAPQNNDG
jgi:SAM dependent carboxyl methyltransferase